MANEEHAEHWNSEEASHWVTHQMRCDTMLAPFGDRLLAAAQVAGSDRCSTWAAGVVPPPWRQAGRR
jgi:hypothetical protein